MHDERTVRDRKVREFMARRPFCKEHLSEHELSLFSSALTHDSYSQEAKDAHVPGIESYERLEFLGDAVIELIACEHIYINSQYREGNMTDFKQEIVANSKISEKTVRYGMDIDSVLFVGNGQIDKRTRSKSIEPKMRADAFEALIGAVYLTYGLEEAKRIVREVLF